MLKGWVSVPLFHSERPQRHQWPHPAGVIGTEKQQVHFETYDAVCCYQYEMPQSQPGSTPLGPSFYVSQCLHQNHVFFLTLQIRCSHHVGHPSIEKVFMFLWLSCPGAGYNGLKTAMIYAKVPSGLDETRMMFLLFFSQEVQQQVLEVFVTAPLSMAQSHFPWAGLGLVPVVLGGSSQLVSS